MLRKLAALVALLLIVACVSAKEYMGTITKLDTEKKTMTVKVGDDEKTFAYTDETEFVGGKNAKTISHDSLKQMAEKLATKARAATITTHEKDGKEEVKGGHPVASKVVIGKGKAN